MSETTMVHPEKYPNETIEEIVLKARQAQKTSKKANKIRDNGRPKCRWLDCAYGMGLAGQEFCHGQPDNENCPHFETEEDFLGRWKKRDEEGRLL